MTWLEDLVAFAQGRLDTRARESLWGRGVTDEQIDLFQLGYLSGILPPLGPEARDFCEWARGEGRIDDVFVLPLTNALGQIQGLQFRHVEQGRKGYREYVIERDEPVYFGFAQAIPHIWEQERAFVVEGAFDVFPVQRVVPYTFATLTARVPEQLIRFLRRLVSHVSLGYDMDKAGREACARFASAHGADFEVQTINYPPARLADGKLAKDPSEIWEAWGDERLRAFLLSTQETYYASNLR